MRKIPKVTMSSILAALLLLELMLEIIPRIAFGLYQDGTLGSPGFTIEPVSLLVGLGVGALAVGIPAAAGRAARARKRKALPEQCEDNRARKIERTGAGDPKANNPPAEGTNASNPIPGIGIVVKRNFGPKSTK
jgi:hypothetical protein